MRGILILLFSFFTIATIIILSMVYVQDLFGEELITQLNATASDITEDMTYHNEVIGIASYYDDAKIDYDWAFLYMWALLEAVIIASAIASDAMPNFNFWSFLLFGTLMFLFAFSFVADLNAWLYEELFINVFTSDITYAPIYNFFNNNSVGIVLINLVGALAINKIFGRQKGVALTNN